MSPHNALILMTSRSGSSMIASIFAAHGYWFGSSGFAGYDTFENQTVKERIRQNKSRIPNGQFCQPFDPCFQPGGHPWFFKGPIEVFPCFEDLPAVRVCVRRDPVACLEAVMTRNPTGDREYARDIIQKRGELMDQVSDVDVFTDEIIAGDFSSIKAAFDLCCHDFDQEKAESVIDRSMWHHKRP